MGKFQKQFEKYLELKDWFDDYDVAKKELTEKLLKIVGEAKKEISENSLPTNSLINLGDYVLVDKKTLEKWFGNEQQKT